MLKLTGKLTSLQRCNICRTIHSRRVLQFTSVSSFKSSSSDGRKEGYGEKEICLLGPIDIRAPLPGDMGIPPVSMFSKDNIQQLPKPAGEDCEIITRLLPEERYQSICTQAAITAGTEILFGSNKTEYAGYSCPELLKRDFLDLFPDRDLRGDNLTVITICRKTEHDMSAWSEASEIERQKHEQFFIFAANLIVEHLNSFHYWADFIHPTSGAASTTDCHVDEIDDLAAQITNATMYQTDLRYARFGFTVEDMGCCRIISHHKWGTHIFVGAIFTNAKLDSKEIQVLLNDKRLLSKNCI